MYSNISLKMTVPGMSIVLSFILCNILLYKAFATIEVTSGAYFRDLPDIVSYEASLPVFFELHLAPSLATCNDVYCPRNETSTLCTLYQKLINPIVNTGSWLVSNKILSSDGPLLGWDFQVVTRKHVKNLYAGLAEYETLKVKLQSWPYRFSISNKPLDYSFTFNCTNSSNKDLTTLFFEQSIKITRIINSCSNRKLDPEVVSLPELRGVINELIIQIAKDKRKLAVNDLARYYTLPITECIFTQNRILIGLQVPLIRQSIATMRLRRFIPVPMAWRDLTCVIDIEQLDVAVLTFSSNSAQGLLIPNCDPYRDQLCLVKNNFGQNLVGIICAHKVLTGETSANLAKYCPYKCSPTGHGTKIITQLTSTNFFLTHGHESFKIFCKNENFTFENKEKYGALDIHLPCECKIIFESHEVLLPEYPCLNRKEKYSIRRVLPAAWFKLQNMYVPPYDDDKFPTFETLQNSLNDQAVLETIGINSNLKYYLLLGLTVSGFSTISMI